MARWFISPYILLGVLLLTGCESSGKFAYRDYLHGLNLAINMGDGTLTDGHMSWPLKNCDISYYCIQSAVFAFAVPKNLDDSPSWHLDDTTYTLSGKRNIRLLGEDISALLINGQQGDQQSWFLYSKGKGLIAFGAYQTNGVTTFFWLEGKCGFGGEQRC